MVNEETVRSPISNESPVVKSFQLLNLGSSWRMASAVSRLQYKGSWLRLQRTPDPGEARGDLSSAEACVNQDPRRWSLEIGAVSATAAAEHGELDWHGHRV